MRRIHSLRTRLIILSLSLITVPFLLTGTVTYIEYMRRLEAISDEYGTARLKQFSINLDRYLGEMERLSLAPLYNNELVEILKAHTAEDFSSAPHYSYNEFQTLQQFLTSLQFNRNELRSVRLYTLDGMVFSYADFYMNGSWIDEDRRWMEIALDLEGKAGLRPPRRYSYDTSDEKKLISYIRLLREPFTFSAIGFIKIDLTLDNFREAMMPPDSSDLDPLILFNREEELIFPPSIENAAFVPRKGMVEFNGALHYVSSYRNSETGISLYGLIPYSYLRRSARTLTTGTAVIALLSLAAAYLLAILFSNRLILPLLHLTDRVHRIRDGDFRARVDIEGQDEIGDLGKGFNMMAEEIQRLVHEVFHVTLKEQEAEILLLQNQMNPHFLYNTLETINMMAVVKDQSDISEVVLSLSRLLRYSASGEGSEATLGEEVAFVRNYAAIQQRRLGDRFSLMIDIPDAMKIYRVPRLVLQPLVENSIEHGMGQAKLTVSVRAAERKGVLTIEVEDNGKGIEPARLEELKKILDSEIELPDRSISPGRIRTGVALRNIHQRIHLIYGSQFGVAIDGDAKRGFRSLLSLPIDGKADR